LLAISIGVKMSLQLSICLGKAIIDTNICKMVLLSIAGKNTGKQGVELAGVDLIKIVDV
jgi:hypothetical protein